MFAEKRDDVGRINSLAIRAQNGDEESMEYLIRFFDSTVKYMSRKYFLPKGEDSEELIQEGKFAVYKAVRTYREESNIPFQHFVKMVIHRKYIEFIKSRNREKQQILNEALSFDKENDLHYSRLLVRDEYSQDPQEIVLARDLQYNFYYHFLKHLTELERLVFYHYLFLEQKPSEIAVALKLKYKSVDNTLRRIRSKATRYKDLFLET